MPDILLYSYASVFLKGLRENKQYYVQHRKNNFWITTIPRTIKQLKTNFVFLKHIELSTYNKHVIEFLCTELKGKTDAVTDSYFP